ncbi:MAG: PEGA domain-containing protein [Pseudomonadota bacterium]
MRFLARIILPILIISSCSLRNQPTVIITADSEPSGAKILIDGVYYGDTPKEVHLIPDKNYQLKLIKDGYQQINYEMETKFNMRKDRQEESGRCNSDLLGSIFIFPLIGLKSLYCRDFTKELYSFELTPIPENSRPTSQNSNSFSSQNYYAPSNMAGQVKQSPPILEVVQENERTNISSSQPLFNSHSEFVNDGNESNWEDRNFNRKTKIDYYNWQ